MNERLKKIINYVKMEFNLKNQSNVAEFLGYNASYLSDLLNGRYNISEDIADKITDKISVISKEWILTGEGEMLRSDNIEILPNNSNISTPIYDIDATCGIEIRDYRDEKIIGWIDIPSINKEAIIIKASGDSMKPVIKDGSMIAIREIKSWDIIVFGQIYLIVTPEYRLLKYIRKSKDSNIVILKSANEEFDDIELPKTQITKLFLVENVLSLKNLI
jgi:SOS-response transcriptional repressor LexA